MTATVDAGSVICPHTEMIREYCGHCTVPALYAEDVKREKRRLEKNAKPKGEKLLGDWFDARFAGVCSRCPTPFEEGEHIRVDFPPENGFIRRGCHERARARRQEAA